MSKLKKLAFIMSISTLVSCSQEIEIPNFVDANLVNVQNATDNYKNTSINEMSKVLNGCREYLNNRTIFKNISEMPSGIRFYFERIDQKYQVSGNLVLEKSGLVFKDYDLVLESLDKKAKIKLDSKEFLLKSNAEKWLKTLPVNKNVKVNFTVRKVSWSEVESKPFVIESFEELK